MPKSPKPSVCDLTSSRVHPTTSAVGVHKDTISEVCRKSASLPESDKPAAAQAVIAEAAGVPRQTITDTLPKMAGLPEVGKSIPNGGSAVWGKTDLLPKMEGLPDSAKPAVADGFVDFGNLADSHKPAASLAVIAEVANVVLGETADLPKFLKAKPAASLDESAEAAGIPQRTGADALPDSEALPDSLNPDLCRKTADMPNYGKTDLLRKSADLPNPLKPDLCSESAELPESNKPACRLAASHGARGRQYGGRGEALTAQRMVLLHRTARCSRLHEIVPFCKMRHRSGSTANDSFTVPTARPDLHWWQGVRRDHLPDGSASWWPCSLLGVPW